MRTDQRSKPVFMATLLFLCSLTSPAAGASFGTTVVREGKIVGSLYAVGGRVTVMGEVEGDVFVAGGSLGVEHLVTGDVVAAGGTVDLRGEVKGTIRVVAGAISLDGRVAGDVVAAGGIVRTSPATAIAGKAVLAGGTVEIGGSVGRGLKAAAGTILVSGIIRGDASLVAERIELLPGALIDGRLDYRSSREIVIHPGAIVVGEVRHTSPLLHRKAHGVGRLLFLVAGMLTLGPLVVGMGLLLLSPGFTLGAARNIGRDLLRSLALGLIILAAVPLTVVILIATIIGIPLGLAILFLYPVLLFLGFLAGAIFIGDTGARFIIRKEEVTRGWEVVFFSAALLLLAAASTVPLVGGPALFLLAVSGMGAWYLQVYRIYCKSKPGT